MFLRVLLLSAVAATVPVAHALVIPANAGVHCAATAEAAVARALAGDQQRQAHEEQSDDLQPVNVRGNTGFRIVNVRFDAVGGRRYALVASCSEPTRPLRSMVLPRNGELAVESLMSPINSAQLPLIRTGEPVTVLRVSGESRVEIHGTALESAATGGALRVQLPSFSQEDNQPATVLHGIAVSAGLVEVQQ